MAPLRILLSVALCLATSCDQRGTSEESGSLVLMVECVHRDEVASNPPAGARDWSTTRNILVELTPVNWRLTPVPALREVTLSADGLSPSYCIARPEDRLRLINASHRPLRLRSLGTLGLNLGIEHGESRDFDLGRLENRETVFDTVGERTLVIQPTRAPVALYVNSHKKITIRNLRPGSWTMRLSHDEIPEMTLNVEIREEAPTELTPRFSVGRLPLVR